MAKSKRIEIKCKGAESVHYSKLTPLQGNLKDLSESNYLKLRKEIIELGFSEPIAVWKKDGDLFLLNGHQRYRTIKKMIEDEDFECADLPVSIVEASDLQEARKKILALTSQYGEMTKQGLYEFMYDSGFSLDEIANSFRFPEINMGDFALEFFDAGQTGIDKDGVKELDEGNFSKFHHTCPRCGFEFDSN